jgi:hypothetical protein
MKNLNLSELDRRILDALVVGDDPVLAHLRQQCEMLSVTSREFSGVGFFTHFAVDDNAPRVEPPNFDIRDVFLEIEGVESGAMAVLFVRDGVIDFLEVVTIAGEWPDDTTLLSISYQRRQPGSRSEFVTSGQRDMTVVREYWAS